MSKLLQAIARRANTSEPRAAVWTALLGSSRLRSLLLIVVGASVSVLLAEPQIAVFSVCWAAGEFLFARFRPTGTPSKRRLRRLAKLIALFSASDPVSEQILAQRVKELEVHGELEEYEKRWLERLGELVQLRTLAFGPRAGGRLGLRQAFVRALQNPETQVDSAADAASLEDILESAIATSELLWKLYRTCQGEFAELDPIAQNLFATLFGRPFDAEHSREFLAQHTDRMAREHGVPFLVLSYIRRGEIERARVQMQGMVTQEANLEEDLRTALYWFAELAWFTREDALPLGDHEATVRYLYHLCFSGPERTGFLEIDSQFFGEFEIINELAREGFVFREALFEKALSLWENYQGGFDGVFSHFLETIAGSHHKLFQQRDAWMRFWHREQERFSREYLYVVEGNLCYAAGQYADALECYDLALKLAPGLRSARLNRVFALARLGNRTRQWAVAQEIAQSEELFPSGVLAAANAYVLSGDSETAEEFYSALRSQPGWELKTDHYRATFCFAHGLTEEALVAAQRAHELNPGDPSVRYHLSQVYNALGKKDRALELVQQLGPTPQWLNYYRFRLERDNGLDQEASRTLLEIPSTYFEDPEEYEEALAFAKSRKDFALLRHLRAKLRAS